MRKLSVFVLAAMLLFGAAACNVENFEDFRNPLPWRTIAGVYKRGEIVGYTVEKTDAAQGDAVVGRGYTIYDLHTLAPDEAHYSEAESRDVLSMETSVTYNDRADPILRGRTDTVVSRVVFASDALTMRYSRKEVRYDRGYIKNADGSDSGQEVRRDDYTLVTDYLQQKSTLTKMGYDEGKNVLGAPVEFSFSGQKAEALSKLVDNEFLFYQVRALRVKLRETSTGGCGGGSVEPGGTGTVKLLNAYHLFENNVFKTYTYTYSCATDQEDAAVLNVPARLNAWGITEGKISCIPTTLSLSGGSEGSGADIKLNYAEKPFANAETGLETQKVLCSIETTEFGRFSDSGYYQFTGEKSCVTTTAIDDYYFGDQPTAFKEALRTRLQES
ncbi:MAG: hypothetical protein LBH24_03590 [Clostridiales bacterium]|jgi:hypothetical protein|nr:hypothetical protein [Clostridiales bacterium]